VIKRVGALVAAGLVLASCGSVAASTQSATWLKNSNYSSNHATLVGDVKHSLAALRDESVSANALHTVCAVLLLDAESANSSLPSPDDQANALLAKAYNNLGAAANTCYDAATSTARRRAAISFLTTGARYLAEGTLRIDVAAGKAN